MIRLYTLLIFVAIATVLLYVFFVMPRPEFVGKTTLLVVAENTTSAINLDHTINDIVYISQDVARHNVEVQKYDADVKISRVKDHNIIEVDVFANSIEDVDTIEYSVMKDITKYIKKQYSLDKDLSITVVVKDGVRQTDLARVAPYIVMIVIAVGVIAGVLALFYLFDMTQHSKDEYDENIDGEKIFAHYNTQTFDEAENDVFEEADADEMVGEIEIEESVDSSYEDEKFDDLDKEKIIEQEISIPSDISTKELKTDRKGEIMTNISTASPDGLQTTPGNLPVINMNELGFGSVGEDDTSPDMGQDDVEPTEEELKARLNELLSGKL